MIASAMSGLNQDSTNMYTMIAEKKQALVKLSKSSVNIVCELRIHLPAMPPFWIQAEQTIDRAAIKFKSSWT